MHDFEFTIDGKKVRARSGQTIMQAADAAGIYIPRLCAHAELEPHGSCRVCMVLADGRFQTACTHPAAAGMNVENDTRELLDIRRAVVDMLFIERNHYCMFCEKSGVCELQAVAYRLGITVPRYPYRYPKMGMDASHQEIFVDHDRCILCARCIQASRDIDHKNGFGFVGRGIHKRLAMNSRKGLAGTGAVGSDKAIMVCPVGALMRKHVGYRLPYGARTFDKGPIGMDIEAQTSPAAVQPDIADANPE
jgi:[NiFe] hydrogenase diaphorase moiety small subunit